MSCQICEATKMSCHLTCPTCDNKFFKISNMSIQSLRKETPKHSRTFQRAKKYIDSELEKALRCNLQLEKENTTFRAEVHDLVIKNDNLLEALNKNREVFDNEFNKLQEEIRANEKQLVENSKKCLEQQKKFVEEIKKLKQENDILKKQRNEIETLQTEKLKSLESEIKIMKLENANLKSQNKENDEKCIKYKTKLKHAVNIVNELNQIIAQYGNKPENTCEMTQTDYENSGEKPTVLLDCSQCGDPRNKRNLNSENLLLSDIFFKPKSFMDSEIELFSAKSKSKCSFKAK